MPSIASPSSGFDSVGGGIGLLDILLKWPLLAVYQVQNGGYIPAALALGAAYYVGGGLPGNGQSMQTYAMAYGAGGLAMYAGLMVAMPGESKLSRNARV